MRCDLPDSRQIPQRLTTIAAVAGLLILAAFSLGKAPGFGIVARALLDTPWFPQPLVSEVLKSGLATLLALVGFGLAKRKPAFYGMRSIAKQDVSATLKALAALFAVVIVLKSFQAHFLPSAPTSGMEAESEDLPLVFGLVGAGVAGLTEEFAYRGYLIEELDALSGRRTLAATVSAVAFGLAHVGSGYGWSVDLIYPSLYGLALTILYLWRRNLWMCVFMHAGLDAVYAVFHAA